MTNANKENSSPAASAASAPKCGGKKAAWPTEPFIICKASAGSGKTFTLVKEYLRLAMAGPEKDLNKRFRTILAITFTNKAANEMKERLMKFLATIEAYGADPDRSQIGVVLLRDLNAMPYYASRPLDGEALRRMAEQLRRAILHRYSDLSVLTIDSFMHRIVRTFAHDLGQPVNFEVMVEDGDLLNRVVEALIGELGTSDSEALTRLMQYSADLRMEDSHSYELEKELLKVAKQLLSEDAIPHLRRLAGLKPDDFLEVHRRYSDANRQLLAELQRMGTEAMQHINSAGIGPEHLAQGARGCYGYFLRLAEGRVKDNKGDIIRPTSYVTGPMESGKLVATKCKGSMAATVASATPALIDCYTRIEALVAAEQPRYNARRQVMGSLFSIALLSEMGRLMREYSRDEETLHLSEFNKMISAIVEAEDAPFIFERLGNRYRHFLIDEHQDTSVMQWHNLVPLLENGVAQGSQSLVVGDAKQSIYRFRQGDVRQFIDLPKVNGMTRHGRTLSLKGNNAVVPLDSNFRTGSAVVRFNNDFFSWLVREHYADNPLLQQIYIGQQADGQPNALGDEVLRQLPESRREGYVEALFDNEVAQQVAELVNRLVSEEGYRYSDILVLARYNNKLNEIADSLKAASVPITSSESFRLRSSHAVCAVVAALRWLYDADNSTAMADLLYRLACVEVVPADWQQTFLAQPKADLPAMLAAWGIDFRPAYLRSLDLYDLCEELVHVLRLASVDTLYMASFLNYAASHTARHRQHLGEFLEAYDANENLSAVSSDQVDAVRLMTYHKAKGLEAPVVICALWYGNSKARSLWVEVPPNLADGVQLPDALVSFRTNEHSLFDPYRDHECMMSEVDEVNNLYVALTRPEDRLCLVCESPDGRSAKELEQFPALLYRYITDCSPFMGKVEPPKHRAAQTEASHNVVLSHLPYADWSSRVSFASPAMQATRRLAEPHVRFGLEAHDLMASVLYADDVEEAIHRFEQREVLDDEEMQRLAALARQAVADPASARFFAHPHRVLTECWMVEGGESFRPDRVVFAEGEVWVVDFKTGADDDSYHSQVRRYCRAIRAAGHPSVKGFLLFLREGVEVVEVEL